jgi:transposase-like protein/IS1 family transposase
VPYSQTKSPRGRKKSVATQGYACPHPHCAYCGITDDAIHALVGYGHHNRIQRFKCQACRKVFTSRIGTPLYYLKTDLKQVEMVLWFLAEGVDVSVMVRFTGCGDATIARWLERMGRHSQTWHNRLFRDLVFTILQLDELYTRVYPSSTSTPPTSRDEFVHLLTVLHPQAERALSHAISCNNSSPSTEEMAAAGRQRGSNLMIRPVGVDKFKSIRPGVEVPDVYTRVRSIASARWLWLAIDPVSKVIPSLHIGGRTRDDAFALVHDVQQRLEPGCVPAFTSDGLRSYLYALTAHFGRWWRPARARKDHWQPSDELHHGMLIKRKHRKRKTITQTRMAHGKRCDLFDKLQAVGLRRLIQTAFIERVNLTFRQGVSALSRRTWAYAQSERHLLLHCEWFRLYYHLVRAHESLRLPVPGLKRRYRRANASYGPGIDRPHLGGQRPVALSRAAGCLRLP